MEYGLCLHDGGMLTQGEMESNNITQDNVGTTVLICDDKRSGGVTANVVPGKGVGDGWVAKRIKEDMGDFAMEELTSSSSRTRSRP